VTLDSKFYAEHGPHFHGDRAIDEHARAVDLMNKVKETSSIIFLNHESTMIKLKRPEGPRTMFKVFGSPYSQFTGLWAFGCFPSTEDGDQAWRQVPPDTDILVTHTPPFGLCDGRLPDEDVTNDGLSSENRMYGCKQLLRALAIVRPMLAVSGHVHEGRGYQRVMWTEDINGSGSPVLTNVDPLPSIGSKKQSIIDLTGKRQRVLQNTSSCATLISEATQSVASSERDDKGYGGFRNSRKETCIVNAAIMAKSWPYVGGKLFNRPIVVDITLPVYDDSTAI